MNAEWDEATVGFVYEHLRLARDASDYQTAHRELEAALVKAKRLGGPSASDVLHVVWADFAIIADRFGETEVAIDCNKQLIATDAASWSTHFALAELYERLGDADQAHEHWRRCAEAADTDNEAVGAVLAVRGELGPDKATWPRRLESALVRYRDALAKEDRSRSPERYAAILVRIGRLLHSQAKILGDAARRLKIEEAATAYREALLIYDASCSLADADMVRSQLALLAKLASESDC
jgi:tetratricopeptide (TPR) repeat protein